jgi:hypothetical protein
MQLKKTERGKEALQNPDLYLQPRIRQILILADGTHSRGSIQDLMERDIGAELHWLLQSGFLNEQVDARYEVRQRPMQSEDNKSVQQLVGNRIPLGQ